MTLVHKLGAANLILVTAAMLEAAPWCVKFFPLNLLGILSVSHGIPSRRPQSLHHRIPRLRFALLGMTEARGGANRRWNSCRNHTCHPLALFARHLRICASLHRYDDVFLLSANRDHRTSISRPECAHRVFAQLDLVVNTLTLVLQLFITGHLMKRLGVGITLVTMPLLSMVGFLALGFAPTLGLLAVFQVARRATNFGFTRPAREVLFTVLRREDKYKAKSLIDTFVYRTGDQIGAWSYSGLRALGLQLTGISFVAVPLTARWCGLCFWLGKKQSELALVQRQETHKSVVRI